MIALLQRTPVLLRTLALFLLCFTSDSLAQVFHEDYYRIMGEHRPVRRSELRPRFTTPPQVQSHNDSSSEFWNVNVTYSFGRDQNEPSIALNPNDPRNLVAGANDYRTDNALWSYTSSDGGRTWLNQELPVHTNLALATDPGLTFNRHGDVFYSNGRLDVSGLPYPRNEVVVYRSTTKGASWQAPVRPFQDTTRVNQADVLSDKYYIATDNSDNSPFKDRIYVAWVEYANQRARIVVSRSLDAGATWSPRVYLTPTPGDFVAPIPSVAPDGTLYVTYNEKSLKEVLISRSTDGGVSFSSPIKIANYIDLGPVVPEGDINARPYIKNFIGVNSFPSIDVDRSTKFTGRVYVSWAANDAKGFAHIYLSHSDNKGQTWSTPAPVEAHESALKTDRFFNWIAIDRMSGDIGMAYYDSRLDPENKLTDLFFSHSTNGGASFTSRRVSSVSFDPSIASAYRSVGSIEFAFFGDYIGTAAHDRQWFPVWTDTREANDQNIFFARVRPYAPHSVIDLTLSESGSKPKLSWQYKAESTFGYDIGDHRFLILRDGVKIAEPGSNARTFIDETVEAGKSYTYSVSVLASDSSKSVEVRFIPSSIRKARPIEIVHSAAIATGFTVDLRIPEKNELGEDLSGLDSLYSMIDGSVVEVLPLPDLFKGTVQHRVFTSTPDTYHKYQVFVSTLREGIRTSSDTTTAYLYAGEPRSALAIDFESTGSIFTPFAWNATDAQGAFASNVFNDSLPNVNYAAGRDTWFLLPSLRIDTNKRTMEFDQMALVDVTDEAIVEVSTDNGVSFDPLATYDRATYPAEWSGPLSSAKFVLERVNLKRSIDSAAVIRFRLKTVTANDDGWFIDNIRFNSLLNVHSLADPTGILVSNRVVRANEMIALSSDRDHVDVRVVDVLGRTVLSVAIRGRRSIAIPAAGTYYISFSQNGRMIGTPQKLLITP